MADPVNSERYLGDKSRNHLNMPPLKRLAVGQREFLCVQYKIKGRKKCTETDVCSDLQQQQQPLSDPAVFHHFTKHIQDHLR